VQGAGFRVQGSGLRDKGLGFRVQHFEPGVPDNKYKDLEFSWVTEFLFFCFFG